MNKEMKLEKQKTLREITMKIGKFTLGSVLIVLMGLLTTGAILGTVAMVYNCFIL